MNDRLKREDWLAEGLRTLADLGASGLKTGPMAARLQVSRGSFYWHFKDLAAFERALLQRWQEQTTQEVIQAMETQESSERLLSLMMRAFKSSRNLERAIRAWATADERAGSAVSATDTARIAYICGLLHASGTEVSKAGSRAAFLYWAYLGQTLHFGSEHAMLDDAAITDISLLFQTE